MIKNWSYSEEYSSLKKKILKKIDNVFKSNELLFGKELKNFEKSFSKKYKYNYCIGVANGTDALKLSLRALNLEKNSEVILPANTAIPTISAIIDSGLKPKFADVGDDFLLDCNKLENYINKKTKVIIPVHLYGQACDMNKILKISKKYNIYIIEDCAQAQGAKYQGQYVGSFGISGCFSFYPTKILGAYGDGGLISTNNFRFYTKILRLRYYGMEKKDSQNKWFGKYYAIENGTNSRLSEVQAGILNIKLPYVDRWIRQRRSIARYYDENIKNKIIVKPISDEKNYHAYHLYVISLPNRDKILRIMNKQKIQINIQYPYPLHKMQAYKKYVCNNCDCLSNSEKKSDEIMSLPMYPNLKIKDIKKIVKILNSI